jgi:hypothetical protein
MEAANDGRDGVAGRREPGVRLSSIAWVWLDEPGDQFGLAFGRFLGVGEWE